VRQRGDNCLPGGMFTFSTSVDGRRLVAPIGGGSWLPAQNFHRCAGYAGRRSHSNPAWSMNTACLSTRTALSQRYSSVA